ncbi:PilZ domain-containing protein [Qipengyuania aurantiaca]|uniref:PilZ domain-containing protein n=1 Tax=Qipengyuania aurantiaca TaxID=2867233 RepID=A0ABX8ZLM8_9SPHN|nr:PilZ domain-containing protein [Qipengyuania aurantiaca]QZD89859.1 PilZ domain-containing protein [Qipengyuania aurantiaca]
MALFQRLPQTNQDERRTVQRYTVDCPAQLKMLGGNRDGRLSDLSEAGARFETANPPQEGVSGLLAWGDYEFFGKIVWANENSCGIVFERPIPLSVVEQTCEVIEVQSGPVANFGNIPVASRGRRASLVSRDS